MRFALSLLVATTLYVGIFTWTTARSVPEIAPVMLARARITPLPMFLPEIPAQPAESDPPEISTASQIGAMRARPTEAPETIPPAMSDSPPLPPADDSDFEEAAADPQSEAPAEPTTPAAADPAGKSPPSVPDAGSLPANPSPADEPTADESSADESRTEDDPGEGDAAEDDADDMALADADADDAETEDGKREDVESMETGLADGDPATGSGTVSERTSQEAESAVDLADLPDDLKQLPDLIIETGEDTAWDEIDEKLGIQTLAYTVDAAEPTTYLTWTPGGQVVDSEDVDLRSFSNRCRDRNNIGHFRRRLTRAKRDMGISRPMRVVGLVPNEVDRQFAATQLAAIRASGFDPSQVRSTVARYRVEETGDYGIVIQEIKPFGRERNNATARASN